MLIGITVLDLSAVPVGKFIAGQGKRKTRKRQNTMVLNTTLNTAEANDKICCKNVAEKEKQKVSKTSG